MESIAADTNQSSPEDDSEQIIKTTTMREASEAHVRMIQAEAVVVEERNKGKMRRLIIIWLLAIFCAVFAVGFYLVIQ